MHGFPAVERGSQVWPDVERSGTQQGQKRQLLDFTLGMLRDDMRFSSRIIMSEKGCARWANPPIVFQGATEYKISSDNVYILGRRRRGCGL